MSFWHRTSKCGKFAYIPLVHGGEATIDADKLNLISERRWYLVKSHRNSKGYARAFGPSCLMHRLIIGAPKGSLVDHINRNGLDNRLVNLRLCTSRENAANSTSRRGSTSRFKGVGWDKLYQLWSARIQDGHRAMLLGRFSDEQAAAYVHNLAAAFYHGDFSNLNNVPGGKRFIADLKAAHAKLGTKK